MITITATEARRRAAGRLLEHVVASGEFVTITHRGRPTAVVVPYPWYSARTRRLAEVRELLRRSSDPVAVVAAIQALAPLQELEARIWRELRDADEATVENSTGGHP
jgi:prevent-host-death family protein